ncbi:MAG: immunoglobulin domain-containing protein, partial [Verrucomicrobiota bacterium]
VPYGITPFNISPAANWNVDSRTLKWGPFTNEARILTYQVSGQSGTNFLDGTGSVDGFPVAVTGNTNVVMDLSLMPNPASPAITVQPLSQPAAVGVDLVLYTDAVGAPPPAFQWRKYGTNLAGATSQVLVRGNFQPTDAGDYDVVVFNTAGAVTSQVAVVTMMMAPVITSQPQSLMVQMGSVAVFSVAAMGVPAPSYQWMRNGAVLTAATADSLTLPNVQQTDAGSYSVVISNVVGSVISSNAVLTVNYVSTLQFSSPWMAGGLFHATLSGHGTNAISVFASTNLKDWVPVIVLPATNALLPFSDPDAGKFQQRFYRAFAAPMQTLADFESYTPGASVMFQPPSYSGSTKGFIDTNANVANFTYVTNSFPAGHAGSRVLKAAWGFKSDVSNPWLRLTATGAANLPNPTIGFNQELRFDLYTDRDIYVALGLRETNTDAPIGGDGSNSGPIEWVGGTTDNSTIPPRGRLVTAGHWTTLEFFIPYEPVSAFTGNGILESTTGKGVLEHLTLVPASGTGAYNLYLDNFQVLDLH